MIGACRESGDVAPPCAAQDAAFCTRTEGIHAVHFPEAPQGVLALRRIVSAIALLERAVLDVGLSDDRDRRPWLALECALHRRERRRLRLRQQLSLGVAGGKDLGEARHQAGDDAEAQVRRRRLAVFARELQ